MSKKKWLTIVIGVFACVCVTVFGLAAVSLIRPSLFNPFMPVYEYEITPSTHDGYSHHTLTYGNIIYESDYTEFGLSTGGGDRQIGQTPMGGQLIEIVGQPDYLVLFDFMSPIAIFHKSGTPPFDWRTVDFNEMHLHPLDVTGVAPSTSTDVIMIAEALAPLRAANSPVSQDQINTNYRSFILNLYSNQLQGMWYMVGVYKDVNGQVYVAENTNSKEWFPASKSFAEWIQ